MCWLNVVHRPVLQLVGMGRSGWSCRRLSHWDHARSLWSRSAAPARVLVSWARPCSPRADGAGAGGQGCGFSCDASCAARLRNRFLQAKAGTGAGRSSPCPGCGCSCSLQNSTLTEQVFLGVAEPVLQGCDAVMLVRGPRGCCPQGALPGSTPEDDAATSAAPCKLPLGSPPSPTPP